MEPGCDRNRVVLMCLFHDLAEARTGDLNYLNKRYVTKDENRALEDQLSDLDFGEEIKAVLMEYEGCLSLESHLAKDSDQLDLILELKEQMDVGNPNARDWLEYAVQRLSTNVGKAMAERILATHSTEWWFNKDTDWWVNGGAQPKKG
jgi:putative hydrolase of HD superfamily